MQPFKPTELLQRLRRLASRAGRDANAAAEENEAADAAGRPNALRLHVSFSDADWTLQLAGANDGVIVETREGVLTDGAAMEAQTGGAVEGLRAALKSLALGERALIDSVVLHPIDPQIEIFDNRSIRAFSPNKEALRSIADNLTGSTDSAFDSAPFGAEDADRRLVAVCRIEQLRRYIAALSDLAPKLARIGPEPVREIGANGKSGAQAIAYIGSKSTIFCAFDAANGVFAMRTAPVGITAFARLVADTNSLPFPEAVQEMANRDMVARAVSAGMDGPLVQITDLIRETLDYVSESRVADQPHTIQIAGPIQAIHGLAGLLQDRLKTPIAALEAAPFDLGQSAQDEAAMNLLRSAVGPVFTEGTREYVYDGERFVGHELARRKEQPAKQQKPNQTPQVRKIAGIEIGGLSGELTGKRLAAIAAGGAAVVLFAGYDLLIAPKAAALELAAARFESEQLSAQTLTGQLINLRSAARRDALAAAGADKVLWAEKFVSVARALPPGLWLTEASIRADNRRVGQVDVVATKLALTGIARSTGRRRLQDIAAFIEALEGDEAFMRDFREITFAGLGGEDVQATFEIHAWYDENKRRESAEERDQANPLQAATNAAAARRRATPGPAEGFQR